jgi:hypothetical protein
MSVSHLGISADLVQTEQALRHACDAAGAGGGAEAAAGDSAGAPGQYDYPGAGSDSSPSGGAGEPFERDLGGDGWDAPGWGSFGSNDGGGDGDGLGGGATCF